MSDQHQHDWSNYWQGRTADTSGEALVGIEHNEELAEFWMQQFAGLPQSLKILDMACGAGSVLRHANKYGFTDLGGVDISTDAITAMKSEFPNAHGIVSPVEKTGLTAKSYGMVVSQFGFEYAGSARLVLAASREMARLVGDKGRFTALCHIKDGGIAQEVTAHLRDIKALMSTKFIQCAKAVFIAADAAENTPSVAHKTAYEKSVGNLSVPREKITAWLSSPQAENSEIHALGQHLYQGTVHMFNRRKAFALSDITGWLDGMAHEIDAYQGRMRSMKTAALNEKAARNILAVFAEQGFEVTRPEAFYLQGDTKPAAWVLTAQR